MTQPQRIWLTRHAETATPTLFHGAESDVDLSPLGVRQALAAAGWFAGQPVDVVVSSAMRRAVATAAPIAAACGAPHQLEPGLHERAIGPLAGQAFALVEGPWAETVARWTAGEVDYTTPGAESYAQVRERVVAAFARVAAAHPGLGVVVVAHGIVCKVLLLTLLGRGPTAWADLGRVANLSVTELTPAPGGWAAGLTLSVPAPVLALNDGAATGLGTPGGQRPQA